MTLTEKQNDTHAELVELCKKGDNKAFKEVYRLYAKAMFSVCVRILKDRDEAEDVLQESFISAFRNIQQFKAESSFGAWLKRIVINKSLDALRKKKVNIVPIEDKYLPPVEEEEIVEEFTAYDVEVIKKGIESLPDGYRIILSLFLFEDLTHKMIAEKLGISEGTSKSQYSRARKKLADYIRENRKS